MFNCGQPTKLTCRLLVQETMKEISELNTFLDKGLKDPVVKQACPSLIKEVI